MAPVKKAPEKALQLPATSADFQNLVFVPHIFRLL